jgi:hypothetical protein
MSAKTLRIGPVMREILATVHAGHVSGMFSTQYGPRHEHKVAAIEGCQIGAMYRGDRTSFTLITDEIVDLVGGGLVAVERRGDFYTVDLFPDVPMMADYAGRMAKRCDVVAVLTEAGRAALGIAEPAPEVTPAAAPAKTPKTRTRKPSASAVAIAATLSYNPIQATTVHPEHTGFRASTLAATLRRMVAAGDVIESADFDGTPLYHLAESARERYAPARGALALAA